MPAHEKDPEQKQAGAIKGEVDVKSILGIDSDVGGIRLTYRSDAERDCVEALLAQAQKGSALYNVVTLAWAGYGEPAWASGESTWPRPDLAPPANRLLCLANWGRAFLDGGLVVNHQDRAVLEQAVHQLRSAQEELFVLLFPMSDRSVVRKLFHVASSIAGAAYLVGAHCSMSDTADALHKDTVTQLMRSLRQTSKRQRAVAAVVEDVFSGDGWQRPFKDADRMLNVINERLNQLGQEPISLSTLYRRRKKLVPKE
jgi:hypothetical protein